MEDAGVRGAVKPAEKEPIARGLIVPAPAVGRPEIPALAKECASILRALDAPAQTQPTVEPEADYTLVLLDEKADVERLSLPDLKDRAASAIAIAEDGVQARVLLALARKRLRGSGAALGARELVFSPSDFGYLGLESDGRRERLEVLLRALVADAERLRLKREGWEEPDE